jgi:hypothetical protein
MVYHQVMFPAGGGAAASSAMSAEGASGGGGGGNAAPAASGSTAAPDPAKVFTASQYLCPAEVFAALCVLGDLLPPEWPPQGPLAGSGASKSGSGAGAGGGAAGPTPQLPAPAAPRRRAALLEGLTACEAQLRRLLAFSAVCEARAVRHEAVRVVARAAGLGPAMPTFCVQPLLEPLTVRGCATLYILCLCIPVCSTLCCRFISLVLKHVLILGECLDRCAS